MIAVTNLFVNSDEEQGGDEEDCRAYDRPVSSVGQRIEELQRRLGGISANELGRRCGGIPGQTLTNIIRASEGNPGYMPRATTLKKLADGAGVSLVWLEHGIGSPDDSPGAAGSAEAPAPAGEVASEEVAALERALFRSMNRKRYLLEDFDETRKALRAHFFLLQRSNDPLAVARAWLEAVFQLRTDGQLINTATIPARASIASTAVPPEALASLADEPEGVPESTVRPKEGRRAG
jgi:transcriptional regulator with XRE-family HTH domain